MYLGVPVYIFHLYFKQKKPGCRRTRVYTQDFNIVPAFLSAGNLFHCLSFGTCLGKAVCWSYTMTIDFFRVEIYGALVKRMYKCMSPSHFRIFETIESYKILLDSSGNGETRESIFRKFGRLLKIIIRKSNIAPILKFAIRITLRI